MCCINFRGGARGVPDRGTHLAAQSAGDPRPRRNLLDGVGRGVALAVAFSTSPSGFVPVQNDSIITVRDVFRCGRCPLLP